MDACEYRGKQTMRILVVDDNDQMREMLRQMLESSGYEVWDAENGKVALDKIAVSPVDLVITDIIMPVMEGIELISNIRRMIPPVKVIAISGGGKIDPDYYLNMADKLGVDASLKKPFTNTALLSVIRGLFPDSK